MYPSSQTSSPRSEAVALHGPKDSSTLVPVRSEVVGRRVKEEWAEQIRASYSLKQSYLALQSSASAYEKEATHQEWTDLLKIKAEMSELAELAESSNSKKAREVGHAESADGLAKFTTVALEYSKMLDVVMNQSPEYAALIWGVSGSPNLFCKYCAYISRRSECCLLRIQTIASSNMTFNII